MTSAPCPTGPMVDSFGPGLWSHPTNPQNSGFGDNSVQPGASISGSIPVGKPVAMSSRGMFLPAVSGILSRGLSHFPVDSAFIERAARLSCFSGGNIGGMMNPFGASEPMSQCNVFKGSLSGAHAQKSELDLTEAPKDASVPTADHGSNSSSPMKSQRDKGSPLIGVSGGGYREQNFTEAGPEGSPDLGSAAGNSSPKDLGLRKRKRASQDMELDLVQKGPQLSAETTKESAEAKQKVEQSSSKPSGKQGKDSSEAPKEDCIHVRARRGQATNSHSLAERVRREKISERMKYLQDLVPGCSKVTGKAVMLDEIINYVQSLQRQVEFLSMKLAAVNPRLDFNLEGFLSKDLLQSRIGSSSAVGFSPDMIHPQLHPSQQGFIQSGISGMVNPSDAIRRAMNAQLTAMNGYKEPTPQISSAWDDELHNVMQMNFGSNPPLNTQE